MIKITNTNSVADNSIVINGIEVAKLNDTQAEQLLSIIRGMLSSNDTVSTPVAPVSTTTSEPKSKTPYVATKDFKAQYVIKEQTATDGTKLFCISRKNGWTKAEKSLMNTAIKNLKGIKEIEVSYEKDGKTRTFKAWGYNTESTAKKHIKELPEVFTVAQLNGEV